MTQEQFDACMKGMKQGDKNSLKLIYEAYLPYIYAIMKSTTGNTEHAKDLTSEFFLKLWEISDSYKTGNGHKAWLSRIAKNLAIDFLRKNKREVLLDQFEETIPTSNQDGGSDKKKNSEGKLAKTVEKKSEVEQNVISRMNISEALQVLNEKEQEIIHMKIFLDMTFKEIAKELEEPMGTITWRYQSGIKKLRRCGFYES